MFPFNSKVMSALRKFIYLAFAVSFSVSLSLSLDFPLILMTGPYFRVYVCFFVYLSAFLYIFILLLFSAVSCVCICVGNMRAARSLTRCSFYLKPT